MPEKEKIYSTKMKYDGVFDFSEFYKFCYFWLIDETQLNLEESKYTEKIIGEGKNLDIEWNGYRKITDFFKMEIKVNFKIIGLKKTEVVRDGIKIKMNEGSVEMKVAGTLVRDYAGKFETSAGNKFLRAIYEKWIIPGRIEHFEEYIIGKCDEYTTQAKAWLDLEGKQ
ncbi:MAG: hypothetical protein AABX48_01465 [Nanoarchaeota archaeon]